MKYIFGAIAGVFLVIAYWLMLESAPTLGHILAAVTALIAALLFNMAGVRMVGKI